MFSGILQRETTYVMTCLLPWAYFLRKEFAAGRANSSFSELTLVETKSKDENERVASLENVTICLKSTKP